MADPRSSDPVPVVLLASAELCRPTRRLTSKRTVASMVCSMVARAEDQQIFVPYSERIRDFFEKWPGAGISPCIAN